MLLTFTSKAAAYPFQLSTYASLSEEYNDNVFFDESDEWDFITIIGLGLGVDYQRPGLSLDLNGGTNAQLYARGTHANTVNVLDNQALQLGTTYQATPRLSFNISNSLARVSDTRTGTSTTSGESAAASDSGTTPATNPADTTPSPTDTTTTPPGSAGAQQQDGYSNVDVLLPRGSAFTNAFSLAANYRLTPRWTATAGYRNSLSNFTDPGGRDLSHYALASAGYQWRPNVSFNAGYSFSHFDFSDNPNADSHSVTVGADYQPSPLWSISGAGGVYFTNPTGNDPADSSGNDITDQTGFTGYLQLDKLFQRSAVSLGARQGVTPSAGVAGLSLTREAFLAYHIRLAEWLSGSVSTSYSYYDTTTTNFSVSNTTAGLSFPVWRQVTGGLYYSYRWRDSSQTVPDILNQGTVDGNLVWFRVGTSWPLWRTDL